MIQTKQNLDLFDIEPVYYVSHFWNIAGAILKEVLHVKQLIMLRFIYYKASIFHYFRNHHSLTLQSKFKVELSMGDLPHLFRTVHTLKLKNIHDLLQCTSWVLTWNSAAREKPEDRKFEPHAVTKTTKASQVLGSLVYIYGSPNPIMGIMPGLCNIVVCTFLSFYRWAENQRLLW